MAQTRRTDFVDVQILQEAVQAVLAGMRVLVGSDVVVIKGNMPTTSIDGKAIKGGSQVTIPYFNTLGNTLDKVPEDGALTPVKLSQSSELAVVNHYGKAFEITAWAELAANWADPYAEAARQVGEATQNTVEDELIRIAPINLAAGFISDVSTGAGTTPHTVTYDDVIAAKMKWGDEQGNISMLSVHSKVYQDMLSIKDSQGRPLLVDPNDGTLAKFAGIPVKISDRNIVTGAGANAIYQSLLFKKQSCAWWYQAEPLVMQEPDALAGSRITAVHVFGAPYRYLRSPGSSKPGVVVLKTN